MRLETKGPCEKGGPVGASQTANRVRNVGFISTRIAGTDGVSLELEKWATVFKQFGWTSFYFAGELDRPPERSYFVEEAHFNHPEINAIEIDGYVTDKAVEQARAVLDEPKLRQEMVDHDYELAKKYFSYSVLHQGLKHYMIEHKWLSPDES